MKISLVKTGVALLIGSSYMFVCGVTGTVGGEAMSQDIPASTAEAEGMEDDIGEAGGQGTLDFLVPDETSSGLITVDLMEMAPLSLSSKMVQSTYSFRGDGITDPTEVTGEARRHIRGHRRNHHFAPGGAHRGA